ncbi:MAG: hypothetical protein KDN22_02215, partial [Verrucomicrobiae bacterium]|nr:hypothetical protein [Verrucomicrobiae bacterium]
QTDPESALDALGELPFNPGGSRVLIEAMETLTKKSPQQAIARALQWRNVRARKQALSAIAEQWAYKDPAAAFAWADGDAPENAREDLRFNVLKLWLDKDPVAAVEHISSMQLTRHHNELLEHAVPALYSKDPTTALKLLDEHLEGASRINAIGGIAAGLSRQSDSQSVTALLPWIEELPSTRRTAFHVFLSSYAAQQPESALTWLNQKVNLGGDEYQWLHGTLVNSWAQSDLAAAKVYVEQLPEGPKKLDAVQSVVGAAMPRNWIAPEQQLATLEQTRDWIESLGAETVGNLAEQMESLDSVINDARIEAEREARR